MTDKEDKICSKCSNYRPKNNKLGFCKQKTKMMKYNNFKGIEDCFIDIKITYDKIIIKDGKKHYIKKDN